MNYVRTAILLAGLTALFMGVGFLIGGQFLGIGRCALLRGFGSIGFGARFGVGAALLEGLAGEF